MVIWRIVGSLIAAALVCGAQGNFDETTTAIPGSTSSSFRSLGGGSSAPNAEVTSALQQQGHEAKIRLAFAEIVKEQASQFAKVFTKLNAIAPDYAEKLTKLIELYPLASKDAFGAQLVERGIRNLKAYQKDATVPDVATLAEVATKKIRAELEKTATPVQSLTISGE